jgi:hypothetical protein
LACAAVDVRAYFGVVEKELSKNLRNLVTSRVVLAISMNQRLLARDGMGGSRVTIKARFYSVMKEIMPHANLPPARAVSIIEVL